MMEHVGGLVRYESFDPDQDFTKVVIYWDRPLGNFELNEAQDIERTWRERSFDSLFGTFSLGNAGKVMATDPASNSVIITSGLHMVRGKLVELRSNKQVSMPAKPTSGTRTDYVFLDVFSQEVTPNDDPTLVNPELGEESAGRIRQVVDVVVTNTATPSVPTGHLYYLLAQVSRSSSESAIQSSAITDKRNLGLQIEYATITKDLTVSGKLYAKDAVTMNKTLTVSGELTVNSNLQAKSAVIIGSGPRWKKGANNSEMHLRAEGDSDYGDLVVRNLVVLGTQTVNNTETITTEDTRIVLNSLYDGDSPSQNAGIQVERGTQANASLLWDEGSDAWKAGLLGSEVRLLTESDIGTTSGKLVALDSSGLIPLARIPATLTGKDADTLDGQHGSYYATATNLTNHINNKNNPHNVTYSQVGAAPASHTHKGSDITSAVASATNADKVDNLHASSFMRSDADTSTTGKLTVGGALTASSTLTVSGLLTASASMKLTGELQINDSNTKLLEGSGNSVKIQTNSGYVEIGPQNTSYCHIYTDRAAISINTVLNLDAHSSARLVLPVGADQWAS